MAAGTENPENAEAAEPDDCSNWRQRTCGRWEQVKRKGKRQGGESQQGWEQGGCSRQGRGTCGECMFSLRLPRPCSTQLLVPHERSDLSDMRQRGTLRGDVQEESLEPMVCMLRTGRTHEEGLSSKGPSVLHVQQDGPLEARLLVQYLKYQSINTSTKKII